MDAPEYRVVDDVFHLLNVVRSASVRRQGWYGFVAERKQVCTGTPTRTPTIAYRNTPSLTAHCLFEA